MKISCLKNLALVIGIISMLFSLSGSLIENGVFLQQTLFLIGASGLLATAIMNKQKMYIALQGVIIPGALIGFFEIPADYKYLILAFPVFIAFAYLLYIKYFKSDIWGFVGSLGLIAIALGFAVNSGSHPFLFNLSLFLGGLFVAIYSAIGFFHYKIRITMLWLVLNVLFVIKPAIYLFEKV